MDNYAFKNDNDLLDFTARVNFRRNSLVNKTSVEINKPVANGDEKDRVNNKSKKKEKEKDKKKEEEKKEWGPEWKEYTKKEKIMFISFSIIKSVLAICCLYLFLLSLSFMSIGFTMISSYAIKAGSIIGFLLSNPFSSLAVGILVTAILQNATATTSIAIILVGAGIIPSVKSSVPIIMGANIGTCVTNSFIALTLASDPDVFKRAFSAATLNDGFNLLTTLLLLPLEIFTSFIFRTSEAITSALPLDNPQALAQANFIGAILNPVCDLFIVLNATAVDLLSGGDSSIKNVALRCCDQQVRTLGNKTELCAGSILVQSNESLPTPENIQLNCSFTSLGLITSNEFNISSVNLSMNLIAYNFSNTFLYNETYCNAECTYWCMPMLRAFGDGGTGLFWVIFSIIVLLGSLFALVKAISLLICGPISKNLGIVLTKNFPRPFHWVSQVILFIIALFLTVIVQSSNIITATLVPLCGIGVISLQQVYVMTLGSNIGTTVTGILTALTQPASSLKKAMQLAFVYTFFNSLGVILWLPIPFLRFPKRYARKLGETVFYYRWLLYAYISNVYFILPLIVFGVSLIPNWIGLAILGIPIILVAISFVILKILQRKLPRVLPDKLKAFDFLPIWLKSLEPYDRKIKKLKFCNKKADIDDDQSHSFANMIRRFSTITPLVNEARRMSTFIPVDDENNKDNNSYQSINDGEDLKTIYITTRF